MPKGSFLLTWLAGEEGSRERKKDKDERDRGARDIPSKMKES